jgi:hypothetical protein
MPDTFTPSLPATSAPPRDPGLPARVVGVLVSPRDTYASVAARPRVLGVMVLVVAVTTAVTGWFLSTEVGRDALLDRLDASLAFIESVTGRPTPPEVWEQMEANVGTQIYQQALGQVVVIPVISVAIAGGVLAVFNAILGGEATFRQALAVVAHSGVVVMLQTLFVTPLNYANRTLTSGTHLGIFVPFMSDTNLIYQALSWIDLFRIWWLVNLAIGIGVLYKRRTTPIAIGLLGSYLVLVLIIVGVIAAFTSN